MTSSIDARELRVLRRNTQAFIDADPTEVVLHRPTRTNTGTGGTRPSGWAPQTVQTMRLLPQGGGTSTERQLPDGKVVRPTWVLLGTYDANMLRGDAFDLPDGSVGEVVYVHEKRAYEVKGEVVGRGPR